MLISTCCSRNPFALVLTFPSGLTRSIIAVTFFIFTVLGATASQATSFIWTTLDHPDAADTELYAISDSTILGSYTDSSGGIHGTLYDGSTWHTLDHPDATAGTYLSGIAGNGNTIVGNYYIGGTSHGFSYDRSTSTWQTLDVQGATSSYIDQIDGNKMVGNYVTAAMAANDWKGILYDGSNWTTIEYPTAASTSVYDIDDANIVGTYRVGSYSGGTFHGFSYDGSNWQALNYPTATDTWILGIDGDNIVGAYEDSSGTNHGLFYDGSTWYTLDAPGATYTDVYHIDGANMVGLYEDSSGAYHGFMVTVVPEPTTALLLGLGLVGLSMRRRCTI